MRAWGARTASLLLLGLAAAAPALAADVFSPGPLARGHAKLEGLPNCTQCHVAGQQLSPDRCLACHPEVKARMDAGRGLHGRLPAGGRACEGCHHEHQGRDFALVDFGEGGERRFDHGRTGYALQGKHSRLECGACHEPRRIAAADAREVSRKGRKTYLGLPKACSDCHFDEHRGQSGVDCARCHDESGWKPAPGFDHARTAYPLEGRHQKVACARCHAAERDPAGRKAFPAAVSERFLRYKPLAHASCADCHKDPHQGRFAGACASCHTLEAWTRLRPVPEATAFHDASRYPLRGKHAEVACKACHGPFAGEQRARWKGLAFGACADCHADAHLGQLGKRGSPEAACDRCHGVSGFTPVRFDVTEHARTRYPLEGGHRAVACVLCHPEDPKLAERFPAAERARLAREGRAVKVSLARFDREKEARRCEACHRDPHAGQFAQRRDGQGCTGCHRVESFKMLTFDHGRDSRFPLEGKHARIPCASCHRPSAGNGGTLVLYRPLETSCAACHPDPHAGQLAAGGKTDCARCHGAEDWKRTRFDHAPPFTSYRLEGKHAKVACEKCHPAVAVGRGVEVRRYKPLPMACEACHKDFHRGAMPASSEIGGARCADCHAPGGWSPARFQHERTGFPLEGRHAEVSCKACHPVTFQEAMGRACAQCHRDPHGGRSGQRCERCHDARSWRATFDTGAHRRTNFPLQGRHALIPCEECHGDRRDRAFGRPTVECYACHESQFASTAQGSIDHVAAGFPHDCRPCHTWWRFSPAFFPQHEACFPIASGRHAGIRCLACHTSIPTPLPTQCNTGTANCIRCHPCANHPNEGGFSCNNQACYRCHPTGTAEGGGGLRVPGALRTGTRR